VSSRSAPSGAVAFRLVQSADAFAAVATAWDALFARAACTTVSLTSTAVQAFLSHRLRPGDEPVVLLAESGAELVGALPLVRHRRFGATVLSTLSDHESYGVDFLIDPAWPASLRGEMLAHLLRVQRWVFRIRLEDVRAEEGTAACLPLAGVSAHSDLRRRASFVEVLATGDEVVTALSSNFRKNLRKQEARLHALPGVEVRFIVGDEAQDSHFADFVALEMSGWKGKNGTAIGCEAQLLAFYRTLVSGWRDAGQLEWQFLSAEGCLIGAHLGVRTGHVLSLLKIAYDEAHAHCGPGNMLFLEMLRREATAGLSREVDCLTDMAWHRNWRMASRDYVTVTLYPQRLVPWLFGYLPAVIADALRRSPLARAVVQALRRSFRRRPATAAEEPA
jgi:CelD/BcsL family acetyltransferase involved in cellulose biosynthesis